MSCLSKSSDCVNARPRFLSLLSLSLSSVSIWWGAMSERLCRVHRLSPCPALNLQPWSYAKICQTPVRQQCQTETESEVLPSTFPFQPACSYLPHARIITGTWQRCTILGLVCATFELTLRSLIKNWSQNAQQSCIKHRSGLRDKEVKAGSDCWFITENNSTTIYYLKLKFMIKWTIAGFTKLLMICAVTQLYRLCCSCRPTVGSWANVISIRKLPQLEILPSHWCPFLCLRLQLTNRRIYIHIYTPHIRRKKRRILRSFSRRTRPPWKFLRCFLLFFSARYIFISFVNWKLLKRVYQKFVQM